MHNMASYLIGGIVATMAAVYWGPSLGGQPLDPGPINAQQSNAPQLPGRPAHTAVDRSHKTDRLSAPERAGSTPSVTSVEVGLRDPAVVLRDRAGEVLFQSDPLAESTTVAKGVAIPQITVRDHVARSATSGHGPSPGSSDTPTSMPAAPAPADLGDRSHQPKRLPAGCEPSVSSLVTSAIAHSAARCVSFNRDSIMRRMALR